MAYGNLDLKGVSKVKLKKTLGNCVTVSFECTVRMEQRVYECNMIL